MEGNQKKKICRILTSEIAILRWFGNLMRMNKRGPKKVWKVKARASSKNWNHGAMHARDPTRQYGWTRGGGKSDTRNRAIRIQLDGEKKLI